MYGITRVRYDNNNTIAVLEVYEVEKMPNDQPKHWSKKHIIDLIDIYRMDFITLPPIGNGRVKRGEDVHTVNGKYLRTDGNHTPADNLGELPEF